MTIEAPVKHNPELHDLVWSLLSSYPPGRLLDIPSGPGDLARQAKAHGFDPVAAEIDESLHVFPELTYQKVDMAKEMPFPPESFDYAVSIEGIEHVENQYLFLRECARILKKNGRLFLTTPNVSSLQNRLLFLLSGAHDNPPGPVRSSGVPPNMFMAHINLIPFQRLETFLRFAGFHIERLEPYKLRPVSQLLYPLIYPVAYSRYRSAFKKHYAGRPNAEKYWAIFRRYLSKEVMCGEYNVVVASKTS